MGWREQWDRVGRFYELLAARRRRRLTWQDQFARVRRWYLRFRETDSGREHDRESDYYQDEAYAFFQNCYHLKDWLWNDPASRPHVGDIERFINNSLNMCLCADLCNGSKHLRLKSRRQTNVGRRQFALSLGGGPPIISAKYEVDSDGKKFDAFTLARDCIKDWETYLGSKGLL